LDQHSSLAQASVTMRHASVLALHAPSCPETLHECGCRKVHLFDIDIPGKMTFKESLTLTPGESGTVVDTPAGRLGIGICYDIRFPELAMLYAQQGAQALVYPGKQDLAARSKFARQQRTGMFHDRAGGRVVLYV